MTTKGRIGRLEIMIERLANARGDAAYVPVYPGEDDAQILEAFHAGSARAARAIIQRIAGVTRKQAQASGLYDLHCLGPRDVKTLLETVDGHTRGIPHATEGLGRTST